MRPARPTRLQAPKEAVLARILPAFEGYEAPAWLLRRIAARTAVGMTIFTAANTRDARQIRELCDSLAAAAPGDPPLLIAADQEGGQLVGLGRGTTAFAGAMALGAAGDPQLTEEVALATGREMRALGLTVCYAPVCDLALTPHNDTLGTRAFGSGAEAVALHATAFVNGLAGAGVAAVVKHFPGGGAVMGDPHHGLGQLDADLDTLRRRELVPFRASLEAGAAMVMSGHFALPGVTGDSDLPATLSRRIMGDLLRRELGFDGLSITDALDMRALSQGAGQLVEAISALRAGVDLLLVTPDQRAQRRLEDGLAQAALRGLVPARSSRSAGARVRRLRRWLARFPRPPMEVVRGHEHLELARRAAARSLTLVRDERGLLPLRLSSADRLAVVTPEPRDLTPADTSSAERLDLAGAVRRHHARLLDLRVDAEPDEARIAAVRDAVSGCSAVIVGTVATHVQPAQARLVRAILESGVPCVTVSLRTPYDLADYPAAGTHVCAWSLVPAALEALAGALFGRTPITGRLPVAIPGLYPSGHGIIRSS